jgi:hypothetical protein
MMRSNAISISTLSPGRSAVCGQAARGTIAPLRATAIPRWPVSTAFSSNKAASVATPSSSSWPLPGFYCALRPAALPSA